MIDVNVDYSADCPRNADPDSCSPSLNRHHRVLWSKRLPNGKQFALDTLNENGRLLLTHESDLGRFQLSSDTIVHSLFYLSSDDTTICTKVAYAKSFPSELIQAHSTKVIQDFWRQEFGIACHTIFPARKIDGKPTINMARGAHPKIRDRFDLSLECIRRFYENAGSINPLGKTLHRYKEFFELFGNFKEYVDYFLLQDLVSEQYEMCFWLPFDDFVRSPLPQSIEEYRDYKNNVCRFIERRKLRIFSLKSPDL